MKFSLLQKGARAERDVELPGFDPAVKIRVRALTGAEEADALRAAFEFAVQKGNEKPSRGDPLYDMGVMANTIALAFVDPDSPAGDRQPFFDGGAKQIIDELSRESIAHLFELQEAWQDECSPYLRRMSSIEFLDKVLEVANAADDAPFIGLSPGTRAIFTRTMAAQLQSYLAGKSLSGAPSPTPS